GRGLTLADRERALERCTSRREAVAARLPDACPPPRGPGGPRRAGARRSPPSPRRPPGPAPAREAGGDGLAAGPLAGPRAPPAGGGLARCGDRRGPRWRRWPTGPQGAAASTRPRPAPPPEPVFRGSPPLSASSPALARPPPASPAGTCHTRLRASAAANGA